VEEKFNLWFILDLTVRIFAMLAVVQIIANYYKGSVWQTVLIFLFILWAFRPVWLNLKRFFKNKIIKKTKKEPKDLFWRFVSGIDYLKGTAIFRILIGLVIVIFGVTLYSFINFENSWEKISISSALWALGLMFIFDGQTMLREYFKEKLNSIGKYKNSV